MGVVLWMKLQCSSLEDFAFFDFDICLEIREPDKDHHQLRYLPVDFLVGSPPRSSGALINKAKKMPTPTQGFFRSSFADRQHQIRMTVHFHNLKRFE